MLNFTMLAQNSHDDYVLQACLAAMSIHVSNPNSKICLITNDPVPNKYKSLFDTITEIPWGDKAKATSWKVGNRWKIYHTAPYEHSIVIDTDMLVLSDISNWKPALDRYDLLFTDKVLTYRGTVVTSNYYRKLFVQNNLANLYSGFHFYKKSDFALEFYTLLETVMNNWELFYAQLAKGHSSQGVSVDISAAIVARILDCESKITAPTLGYPTFTHMKSHCQDWNNDVEAKWQSKLGVYMNNDLELKIGNYTQTGIFHYTEKEFASTQLMQKYEKKLGI